MFVCILFGFILKHIIRHSILHYDTRSILYRPRNSNRIGVLSCIVNMHTVAFQIAWVCWTINSFSSKMDCFPALTFLITDLRLCRFRGLQSTRQKHKPISCAVIAFEYCVVNILRNVKAKVN